LGVALVAQGKPANEIHDVLRMGEGWEALSPEIGRWKPRSVLIIL
jgi:hypothetical protein